MKRLTKNVKDNAGKELLLQTFYIVQFRTPIHQNKNSPYMQSQQG